MIPRKLNHILPFAGLMVGAVFANPANAQPDINAIPQTPTYVPLPIPETEEESRDLITDFEGKDPYFTPPDHPWVLNIAYETPEIWEHVDAAAIESLTPDKFFVDSVWLPAVKAAVFDAIENNSRAVSTIYLETNPGASTVSVFQEDGTIAEELTSNNTIRNSFIKVDEINDKPEDKNVAGKLQLVIHMTNEKTNEPFELVLFKITLDKKGEILEDKRGDGLTYLKAFKELYDDGTISVGTLYNVYAIILGGVNPVHDINMDKVALTGKPHDMFTGEAVILDGRPEDSKPINIIHNDEYVLGAFEQILNTPELLDALQKAKPGEDVTILDSLVLGKRLPSRSGTYKGKFLVAPDFDARRDIAIKRMEQMDYSAPRSENSPSSSKFDGEKNRKPAFVHVDP